MIRARDVYDVLGLPNGLRIHMLRTVAVVEAIGTAGSDDPEAVRKAALAMALHDVGNIVKPVGDGSLLGEPPESLARWRLYAEFSAARYGDDEHRAARRILGDLGVEPELIELIDRKSSRNLPSILDKGKTVELLALYADMRVSPSGLASISERHEDAMARYAADPSREGLGGTIAIEELEELENVIAQRFEFDPLVLAPETVEAGAEACMEMDLADAFG